MGRIRTRLLYVVLTFAYAVSEANGQSQVPPLLTRFTVGGAPMLSEPKEQFGSNVGRGFGGGGMLLYHVDRSGLFSLRFDASGFSYGHEEKRVPFSETVGGRVLVDVWTTNWAAAFGFGPELAVPKGPVRPYLNTAFTGLLFRTTSSVGGADDGSVISSTNYSDATRAWVIGSGVAIPLSGKLSNLSLDLGVRYHRGGQASYLREGSIQDNPNGSITITSLNSRTPYLSYLIGVRFRIPYASPHPCPRFLC